MSENSWLIILLDLDNLMHFIMFLILSWEQLEAATWDIL